MPWRPAVGFFRPRSILTLGFWSARRLNCRGAPARVTDGQFPDQVTLSAGADGTAGAMADAAVEQRAAKDLG